MRITIGKIFIFLSLIICSLGSVSGQNDYERHIAIISQVDTLVGVDRIDDALMILKQNEELFQYDEFTHFWYNWMNGVILYQSDKYTEARPFIVDAISFLDANQNELSDPNLTRFLQIYFYAPNIDYILRADKDSVLQQLEHAKYIYEIAHATTDPFYDRIIDGIKELSYNNFDFAGEALKLLANRDYQQAVPYLLKVIEHYKANRTQDYKGQAVWLRNIAMAYMYIGDYQNSEKYFELALELLNANNLHNEKIYRLILDGYSFLAIELQNVEKASKLNDNAKILFEEALDFGDEYVTCVNNSASIQYQMGHNTTARMMLNVALRQAKLNLSDTISINSTLEALNWYSNGQLKTASLHNDYYTITRIIPYVALLSNSSVVYSELGYIPDAIKTIKEAIKVSEQYGLDNAMPYNNLGMLYYDKSKFPESIEWFLKGYSLCKTPNDCDEIGMNLAKALFFSKDARTANHCVEVSSKIRKNIQDMFSFMSGNERAIYWKHFENYLPMLNHIIYESGNLETFGTIYDNILEAKGLLLRSTNDIRDAILNSGSQSDIADYSRICKLKQHLLNEKNEQSRVKIENEIDSIDKRLTQHANGYADFVSSKTIKWIDVCNALAKDDVAIEFYNIPLIWGLDSIHTIDGEPRYCAVLLRKGYKYPHIIPLCKESQLEELDKEDLYETDSIYNMLWKPLEEELKGAKNIYFAADRELHKIGIEYAPLPGGGIVGDKFNLYRLSSTRVLAEKKKESRCDNAVLYGGLRYDVGMDELIAESRSGDYHPTSSSRAFTAVDNRYGVKYLPGTLKEVEEISRRFANQPRLITDICGTEESFKSLAGSSTDIIHLATHGFFWSEGDARKREYVTFLNPLNHAVQSTEDKALLRSGLFFSGANIGLKGETLPDDVEDGVLTALELSNMNLGHVDMVVMSACESGLGETSGEGVFGLQRGFKLAGANTLLMSLWKVDDNATQKLMTEFYRNYLSGKSKQMSRYLAQQMLRNSSEYSDPQYWAAFILLDGLN